MRLDWIVMHPGTLYAALAVSLSLCLYLFVSLKGDQRAAEKRWQKKSGALEADLQAKMAAYDERWKELSQSAGLLVPPTPPRSGLNQTTRSQALQMLRRGVAPEEIASALSLPQNEIDLLIQVQRITLAQFAGS